MADAEISRAWIAHTGDGTLIHDTDRSDTELQRLIKAARFRWSRNLGAWYLPRAWHYDTRTRYVDQLVTAAAEAGRTIPVERDRTRSRTVAEVETDRVDRAKRRADRLHARADQLEQNALTDEQTARQRLSAWPFGQPLVGSPAAMQRQRSFMTRERARLDRALHTYEQAQDRRRRAHAAEQTARANENPGVISRRIQRLQADLRRVERAIAGEQSPWSKPATGESLDRLTAQADELREQIRWNEGALRDAEKNSGRLWAADDFRVGDEALIGSVWYPVKRVNRKSLTVPALLGMGSDHYSWTDTVPYDKIGGRRRDGVTLRTPPASDQEPAAD